MRKKIQIALVDSGIDKISKGYQTNITYINNEQYDTIGHGTMCFNLIMKYLSSYCDINIVKVLDQRGASTTLTLNNSLSALLDSDVKIINLSLALLTDKNIESYVELEKICNKLYNKNKIIICSLKNRESDYSAPAGFPTVLGVRGACLSDERLYWYDNRRKIQVVASETPVLLRSINGSRDFFSGNSKATAIMTCNVAKLLTESYDDDIYGDIYRNANRTDWSEDYIDSLRLEWMNIERINKDKIDKQLLHSIKDIICNYFGQEIHEDSSIFSFKLGTLGIAKKEDCINIINLLEKRMKYRFNDDVIKITDFENIYSLSYAVQERWHKY